MDDLIALLLWLTGQPPQEPPVPPTQQTEMERLGGGIPTKPASNAAE
jgi:hypothetical protein